jgi:hypothetical protein
MDPIDARLLIEQEVLLDGDPEKNLGGEGRGPPLRAQTRSHGDRLLAQAGNQVKRTLLPPWVQVTKRPSEWTSRLAVQLKPSTEQVLL